MKCIKLLILVIFLLGCSKGPTCMEKTFGGEHKLRKFNVYTETGTYSHGSFFLFTGGYSSGTRTEQKVKFSWLGNDGNYVLSEIEPEAIRVHLDSAIQEPYITFNYDKRGCVGDIKYDVAWHVHYITLFCKESDYPLDVNIKEL